MRPWNFELRINQTVMDSFTATCPECHRRADEMATRLGDIDCYAYNQPLAKWERMGTYHGIIKQDYSGMFAKTGKEATNEPTRLSRQPRELHPPTR